MAYISRIDGMLLRNMFLSGVSLLQKNKEQIDALNVFPVPDGDTGTNMSLTMLTAVQELYAMEGASVYEVAQTVSKGALKGARGNSGVILSQILRGFARGLENETEITASILARALAQSTETAYKAVMRPREGTILSVTGAISQKAQELLQEEDLLSVFTALVQAGEEMLNRTPDMLPVLKQAGVVDAGGMGLLTIYKGMLLSLNGQEENDLVLEKVAPAKTNIGASTDSIQEEDILFGYCSELFIENIPSTVSEQDVDALRETYASFGDCVLVVGDLDLLKVHVHSNDPGRVLQTAQKFGEITNIKIDNMRRQHRNLIEEAANLQSAPKKVTLTKEVGIVSVSAGEGLTALWHDLMVDEIILGGQTMNPSAEDIVRAIEKTQAKTVFVLPNNSNIILAATQAAQLLTEQEVLVVPTKTVPQGVASLVAFLPELTPSDNFARMTEALSQVRSASVTYAVRDSNFNEKEIHKNDILGLEENDVRFVGHSVEEVLLQLLQDMLKEEAQMVTLYSGMDVSLEEAEKMQETVQEVFPDCDVTLVEGGQPLYYYLVAVEE